MGSRGYIKQLKGVLNGIPHEHIDDACEAIREIKTRHGTLFLFGNGGSAALASHLACDLSKGFKLKTNCLNDHISEMTAISNDTNYDKVFVSQLATLVEPNDMVFAISTSGESKNIIRALKYANKHRIGSIGLSGGNTVNALVWYPILVTGYNDNETQLLEDVFSAIIHIIYLKLIGNIR